MVVNPLCKKVENLKNNLLIKKYTKKSSKKENLEEPIDETVTLLDYLEAMCRNNAFALALPSNKNLILNQRFTKK